MIFNVVLDSQDDFLFYGSGMLGDARGRSKEDTHYTQSLFRHFSLHSKIFYSHTQVANSIRLN